MLKVALLVISSKVVSGQETDTGREELERMVRELPGTVAVYACVPDDRTAIREQLLKLCDSGEPDVVLTIGGTGVRQDDWAPEATRDVIEKEIPGIGEAMRMESLKKMRTAMLSRGTAGIRGSTLIVNLPGSPRGAKENLAVILPILDHTVEKIGKRHA
ncbi:MAG: MogA/MoaB family molybdenum cofactor biosynthesis protein [Nitrospirota bacterium]